MMFLKSWGVSSRHHGCFNTKMVIHDLDDLGVARFQETATYMLNFHGAAGDDER